MSLFERIQNKRYDLQERTKKFPPKDEGSANNTSNTTTETPPKSGPRKIKKKLSTTGRGFEDVTGEGIKKGDYPKTRKELEAKRKEYGIDPKTNQPSKEGIKRYAEKAKQLKSGSNVPVKVTKAELDKAKEKMVGGRPVMGMGDKGVKDKVIGTTTGRYGGKLNPLATKAELDAIKAEIKKSKTMNVKPLPKVFDKKASKELGTDVFRRIKKTLPSTKTLPGKIIDTPKRRIKILKPLPSTKPLEPLTKTAYNPYKATSRFGRVLTALKKNPKTALAAAAIGTGVYLYNKGKNTPKGIIPPPVSKKPIIGAKGTRIDLTLSGKPINPSANK